MKRAIALALVAGIAAAFAATAVARPDVAEKADAQQAVSCKSTVKIAIVTPLTGGAGFLGQAQLTWAKYAVKRLAPGLKLKVQLLTGDTPVEQGPAPAQALAQKYVADQKVRRGDRPGNVRRGRGHEPDVLLRRRGAHLAVGNADVADQGQPA